jgi:hypothetical protein
MSVDKPQTISSDEAAITLGNELIVDDIAKGLIAKQSLDIPFEAPILGSKIEIVDKCENETIGEPLADQIKEEMSLDEPTIEMAAAQTKDESEENFDKETVSKEEDHCQVEKEKSEEEIKEAEPVICESQTASNAKEASSNGTKISEGKHHLNLLLFSVLRLKN